MYCPYCATKFSNDELHTTDQIIYLKKAAEEQAKEYIYGQIDEMFGKLAKNSTGNRSVKITHTPIRYKAMHIQPHYKEHKVDSELICPDCGFRFQVYGLFGFCPGCGTENMMIYDANLMIIRKEINESQSPERSLRHAYSDLVSTFQIFCEKKVPAGSTDVPSFQELFLTRKFFKDACGVDIFKNLSDDDLLILRCVFQKRHIYQHSEGQITELYLKKVPEDYKLLGTKAVLSLDEFEKAARIIRGVLGALVIG